MRFSITIDNEKKIIQSKEFDGTLAGLLRKLRLQREEVVVKVNGKLVPETRKLGPKDKVEIITVIFGG